MVDANIPDIALEPDKTVKKVSVKLSVSFSNPGHLIMKFSITCDVNLLVSHLKKYLLLFHKLWAISRIMEVKDRRVYLENT